MITAEEAPARSAEKAAKKAAKTAATQGEEEIVASPVSDDSSIKSWGESSKNVMVYINDLAAVKGGDKNSDDSNNDDDNEDNRGTKNGTNIMRAKCLFRDQSPTTDREEEEEEEEESANNTTVCQIFKASFDMKHIPGWMEKYGKCPVPPYLLPMLNGMANDFTQRDIELEDSRKKNRDLEKKHKTLQKERQQLLAERKDLKERFSELPTQKTDNLTGSNKELEERNKKLEETIQELRVQLQKAKQLELPEMNQLVENYRALQEDHASLEKELKQLRKAKARQDGEMERIEAESTQKIEKAVNLVKRNTEKMNESKENYEDAQAKLQLQHKIIVRCQQCKPKYVKILNKKGETESKKQSIKKRRRNEDEDEVEDEQEDKENIRSTKKSR